MRLRWILYFDGACPLCMKTQYKLKDLISPHIKLTAVDLNSGIAKTKGFTGQSVVLETPEQIYTGHNAWLKILSETKYKWLTNILLRPFFIMGYIIVSKNRKRLSKKK